MASTIKRYLLAASLFLVTVVGLTLILYLTVFRSTPFGIDQYVYWNAGRALFLRGENPYSASVTLQNQRAIYGGPARPDQNQMQFVNPLYSLLAVWPSLWMAFPMASAYWLALQLTALVTIARLCFPRVPLWILTTIPFFYPVARGFIMGQFSLTITILILLVYGLIVHRPQPSRYLQFLSGALLAWTTIKPQFVGLILAFFFLYAFRKRYHHLFAGFIAGGLFFLTLSLWWMPTWPLEWLQQVQLHAQNRHPLPWVFKRIDWFVPAAWAQVAGTLLIATALCGVIYSTYHWWKGHLPAVTPLAWYATLSFFINPLTLPPEQAIFLPPLLAWIETQPRGITRHLVWAIALVIPFVLFAVNFTESEPVILSAWPPVLFAAWVVAVTTVTPLQSAKMKQG